MKKVLIWGAGKRTADYINKNLFKDCNVLAIVDTYVSGDSFKGYPLISPVKIQEYNNYDYIVISNQHYQEILLQLLELRVEMEKVIITDNVKEQPYHDYFEKLKGVMPSVYEIMVSVIKHTTKSNERDLKDSNSIYSNNKFNNEEYTFDYYRYRTFEFIAEKIQNDKIEGDLAEVGVFRGLFSAVINYRLPDRKIFLFDTFEGFNEKEAECEYQQGRCSESFIESHKDTSVEKMIKSMPYPEKAVICKGFFPDTVTEEAKNTKYAFVSLDVDFEKSTFEGLKFFYPRLADGGYIFVHDYNTYFLDGIKVAVNRYENYIGHKLKTVPIADRAGTLVIIK